MANCSSCNAAIIWGLSPLGAKMPYDAKAVEDMDDPRPTSRSVLYRLEWQRTGLDDEELCGTAIKQSEIAAVGFPLYLSHFVTCPNASQHSRKASAENRSWQNARRERR